MSAAHLLIGEVLAWSLVVGALALPFAGGYPLAYAMMMASLLLIIWWLASRPRLTELAGTAGIMMVAGVLLIGVAFAATATKAGDLAYVFNFTMLALFPMLRAALARLARPQAMRWVSVAALTGAVGATLLAAIQVGLLGYPRAPGFGSDPIWAAQAALLTGFLAVCGIGQVASRWRYLFLLGPVFGLIAIVFTGSRGPLLAALPLLVIAIIMMPGRRLRLVMAALGTAILVSVLAVVLFTDAGARLRVAAETVVTALSAESKGDPAVGGRLALYAAGLSAFVDAPVAGYGWEQRLAAAYARVPGGEAAITSADPMMRGNHHLHADLLDFGVGAGLLGLAAYALFLAAPFAGAVASQRDGQREARMLGAALLSAAFFFCGLSYIMIGYEFPTTLYVVAAAILLGLCGDRRT